LLWYHTVGLSGLSPNTTYHYRVKSRGDNNLTGVSADYVFTTTSVAVPDIIVNDADAETTYSGAWTYATGNLGYAADYHWGSSAASETRAATFRPTIATAGNYDVYITFIMGANRANNSPWTVSYGGGTANVMVNQTGTAGASSGWVLIASGRNFAAGNSGFVKLSNNTGATGVVVVADAVKFVFVPPPPTAPSIATHPQNLTINQGNTANFTVSAGGTAPLTYQWKHAGTNIPGATNIAYVKNNVQPADAGNYSVGITNGIGFSNSFNAVLTVNLYPVITSQPSSTNVNVGADVTFAVTATGTGPLNYQWRFNNADIPGATTNNYTQSNVQLTNTGNYSVVVSNVAGTVTSDDALLTVIPPGPRIDSFTLLTDGQIRLQISGAPGHYGIDGATNLTGSPLDWSELTNFFTTTDSFEFTDSQTNLPQRFYRAKALSP
jgi:hypothetical protein